MLNIVIPAYEPDNKLLTLIDSLKSCPDFGRELNILIVNDGSSLNYNRIFPKRQEKAALF